MIYFVKDPASGNIKIGFSQAPLKRFDQLQTAHSGTLELLAVEDGDVSRERELHDFFADFRLRGEWFSAAPELRNYIASIPHKGMRPVKKSAQFWNGKTDVEVSRETGIPQPVINRIRNGQRRASPEVAIVLQRATGVSAIQMVFGDLAGEAE